MSGYISNCPTKLSLGANRLQSEQGLQLIRKPTATKLQLNQIGSSSIFNPRSSANSRSRLPVATSEEAGDFPRAGARIPEIRNSVYQTPELRKLEEAAH
ncbi:hypothetical protein IFM89_005890 [Coptis chinensis]|uniref:Uncharacterized protein n=1 Tax=Coptis chinensis TaxID=261450 RepID=A0A835HL30_9MAGN|nr:hypothetical protein IFM89_005890 [Coptis chinensis]